MSLISMLLKILDLNYLSVSLFNYVFRKVRQIKNNKVVDDFIKVDD
jgi:type III secretory pathway component EscU